jgi:uncharacterized protein
MDYGINIEKTMDFCRKELADKDVSHDWWHAWRVFQMGQFLNFSYIRDYEVIAHACLLHDIADWKLTGGDPQVGLEKARQWLDSIDLNSEQVEHICAIISNLSFKGAGVPTPMETIEGKIVQDADRLDAMGAIGIARAFAYGGSRGREIYDPAIPPHPHQSFEEYKRSKSTSINHFHEKLLLLKDRLNTEVAKEIAQSRHRFMEEFLHQFLQEWNQEGLFELIHGDDCI